MKIVFCLVIGLLAGLSTNAFSEEATDQANSLQDAIYASSPYAIVQNRGYVLANAGEVPSMGETEYNENFDQNIAATEDNTAFDDSQESLEPKID